MPTEIEIKVLRILSAIETPPNAATQIEAMGTEAVTVLSEIALGTYPGIRPKIRSNAVALIGQLDNPQAVESMSFLINDSDPDISVRAIRAAGRQKNVQLVERISSFLERTDTSPIVAAEAVKGLMAIGSSAAHTHLEAYKTADPAIYPHRDSRVVKDILRTYQRI